MTTPAPLLARLWTYQAERFPLAKTVPLLAVFSAASINISAILAGRELPGLASYLIAFGLVLIVFFQLRVCDEIKDLEDDKAYRPERPIPRGLVRLREIVLIGGLSMPVAIGLALLAGHGVIWLLLLVWAWLAAMTFEFGVPHWLKARPVVYLLSHMAIMPLLDLLLTGIEWTASGAPHPGLWTFLALSLVNGCVLELGRKLWATDGERDGVETYSKLWGPKRAALAWMALIGLASLLLIGVGCYTGDPFTMFIVAVAGFTICLWAGLTYAATPSVEAEKRVDAISGFWVFLCYFSAGFLPILTGASA